MKSSVRLAGAIAIAAVAGYLGTGAAHSDSRGPAGPGIQLAAADAVAIVKERQALMKENGKHAKAIGEFVESSVGTADDVAKHAAAIEAASAKIVGLFPAGTGIEDGIPKTGAKPEIWEDQAGFSAAATKLGELADALEQAAATGDKQQIADAFGALGKNGCGGCHSKFRKKLD